MQTRAIFERNPLDEANTDMRIQSLVILGFMLTGCGSPPLQEDSLMQTAPDSRRVSNAPQTKHVRKADVRGQIATVADVKGGRVVKDSQVAEVLGVCRYDEDTVSCWHVDGSAARDLSSKIEAKLVRMAENPRRHGTIPWDVDRINRIVVTRTTAVAGKPGPLTIESVADGRSYSGFMVDEPDFKPKGPWTRTEAKFFSLDKGVKSFSVTATQALSPAKGIMLEFKEGAKGSSGSVTAEILKLEIQPASPTLGRNSRTFRQALIKLRITGLDRKSNISPMVQNKPLKTGEIVDMSRMMPIGPMTITSQDGDVYTLEGTIDPANVQGLGITIYQLYRYRLVGLPVKP